MQRSENFTRDVGCKNDRLGSMHTSDHRRSIRGFTLSCEALGRLLKKKKKKRKKKNMMTKIRKSRMSDFSCEKTKVCMDS